MENKELKNNKIGRPKFIANVQQLHNLYKKLKIKNSQTRKLGILQNVARQNGMNWKIYIVELEVLNNDK